MFVMSSCEGNSVGEEEQKREGQEEGGAASSGFYEADQGGQNKSPPPGVRRADSTGMEDPRSIQADQAEAETGWMRRWRGWIGRVGDSGEQGSDVSGTPGLLLMNITDDLDEYPIRGMDIGADNRQLCYLLNQAWW